MKKILVILASATVMLTAGYSTAFGFSDYNDKCSNCHNKELVGKAGGPKKLVLPSKTSPVDKVKTSSNTLKSVKADREPVISGKGNDQLWNSAPSLPVATSWLSPNPPKDSLKDTPVVNLKSLHTDKKLYILATWADPSPDLEKDRWEYKNGKWSQNKNYDEDRLAIQWDMGAEGFKQVGCAITCHGYTKDYGKYTNKPGEKVDLWHWKSTRSNPLNWTDDGLVNYVAAEEVGTKKGRSSDTGTGGEQKNEQTVDNLKMPKYSFAPSESKPEKPFLFASSAVLFNQQNVSEGSVIPGYLSTDTNKLGIAVGPTGSRADVQTFAHWEKGKWTLEIVRNLDTGNKDDVTFRAGETKAFGIAAFNNNTNFNHAVSNVLFLELQIKKQDIGKVTARFLNLRSGAGTKNKISGVLKKGEQVILLKQSGKWLLVKTEKGKNGYVYARWIKT